MDLPAVLSEELDHLGKSVENSITKLFLELEEKEFWLLGASYNSTSKFESEKSMKCGKDFCYRKSLDKNKICKPGKLHLIHVKAELDSESEL